MKKILNIFVFALFLSFAFVGNVKAASVVANPTTINVGKSTTLTITVVSGNIYKLTYDESFLEAETTTCGNKSNITGNCTIKLKAKNALSLEADKVLTISLTETGDNDAPTSASITIKANTTPKTTTTTTTNAQGKSNNANLKTLEVLTSNNEKVEITPAFASNVYEYNAEVPATVKTVIVTATMEDSKANVIISDNVNDELKAGENNKITIKVTAEDGTAKLYTLNIKREALSADPGLVDLIIAECKNFKFIVDKYGYTVKVAADVTKLTIDAQTKEETTMVEIDGNENLKNGSIVKVRVTAEDGTARLYTLTIVKDEDIATSKTSVMADKSPLIVIGLSAIALFLVGAIVYVIKK